MRIRNIHERRVAATEASRDLIDGLARDDDRLWPHEHWPPMRFDRPPHPPAKPAEWSIWVRLLRRAARTRRA
jgi:hypothetical protein